MKIYILTFAALLMLHRNAYTQFQVSIGTGKPELGKSVQLATRDPGYMVGGYSDYALIGNRDATLVKTKPDGSIDWSFVYGGIQHDLFNSVREVPFTNSTSIPPGYAALGTTSSFGFGSEDLYLVRTDLAGTPLFTRVLGGKKIDRGHCLQFIKDRSINGYGYVLVGETTSYPYFAGTDVYVAKLDEVGNLVQAVVIGGEGDETGYWIEQTRDEGYIIAGTTTTRTCGTTITNQDIFVVRLRPDLSIVWNVIIGAGNVAPYNDIAYGVVENPDDGSFTVTGITESFGVSNRGDAFLLNLNSAGSFNWMKTYGLELTEQGNSIHLTRSPFTGRVEYVVSGYSNSYSGYEEAYVFKTDALGTLQWTSLYAFKDRSLATEITDNGERGFIFTGRVDPYSVSQDDIYLVKIKDTGESGTGCDLFVRQSEKRHEVCITSSAQYVYVRDIERIQTPYDNIAYDARRCETAGASAVEESKLDISVSPNPSQDQLKLSIDKTSSEDATVKIYNSRGALVTEQTVTDENVNIQISHLPKDLYIIHFIRKDGSIVHKRFVKK